MSLSATVWFIYMLFIVFGQECRLMAQMNLLYQALATHVMHLSSEHVLLV